MLFESQCLHCGLAVIQGVGVAAVSVNYHTAIGAGHTAGDVSTDIALGTHRDTGNVDAAGVNIVIIA